MMPNGLSRSQGEALTALLHQLRRDWGLPGIAATLRKTATLGTAADITVAAVRCAANPQMRTPALIAEPGPHWQGTDTGQRMAPIMCVDHPQNPARNCLECVAQSVPPPPGFVVPKRDKHVHDFIPEEEL